jgi:hypothetical protein
LKFRRVAILLCVGSLAACDRAPSFIAQATTGGWMATANVSTRPVRVAPDLIVRKAEFGRLDATADGDEQFTAVEELPPDSGQVFGWVLTLDTRRKSVHWQERLRLPKPPADWGDAASDPDIVITKDGRTAMSEGDEIVDQGEVQHFYWALAAGDPPGDYQLDVALEGRPVAHFVFRVPAPVQEKSILVRAPNTGSPRTMLAQMTTPAGVHAWR